MKLRLKKKEDTTEGLLRIIRGLAGDTEYDIRAHGAARGLAVHDVHTRCKKMRAALRLLRPGIGKEAYRRENCCLRDAMRPITRARDAEVLVGTLDKIAGRPQARAVKEIRNILKTLCEEMKCRMLRQEDAFGEVTRAMHEVSGRLRHYSVQNSKFLQKGILKTYRKAYIAFAAATKAPDSGRLHEWRKQSKYLMHEIWLLGPLRPAKTKKTCEVLRKLTNLLGDDHDLFVLSQTLKGRRFADVGIPPALPDAVRRRRKKLQRKSLAMGKKLYRDKPRKFIGRFTSLA